jgi:hypothetical protein
MQWQLLGTGVLYGTARYPNTRTNVTLTPAGLGFTETDPGGMRPIDPDYPHYRSDGGIDC